MERTGHKGLALILAEGAYVVALGPFVLVFYLCRAYFDGWPDAFTIAAFVVSLVLRWGHLSAQTMLSSGAL